MALFSSLLLAEGGGGGQVVTYQPAPQPYLPPPPSQPAPSDVVVTTGVNVPTGIAPVNNPTVIPFTPYTGPGEVITYQGGGGGLQIPAPAPSQAVAPAPSQPPTTSCSTCGPKTSQPPTSSAGGASASTQQPGGGALLAGLQPGSENWGLLLLMLALGVALYEGVKERKRGGR